MGKKPRILFLFVLAGCGIIVFLFTSWAAERELLSPEIYFFSFRARWHSGETLKNLFLTYPPLPFFLALLAPSELFLPVATGLLIMILASTWLFPAEPVLVVLFLLATVISPFFLSVLCVTPALALFFTLILGAWSFFLQYEECRSVYHLFLGGIFLGAAFLTNPHVEWLAIATLFLVLLFFSGNLIKKTSLFVVILFPVITFFSITLFLNWVYTERGFAFLRLPYSFAQYFPSFSFTNLLKNFALFPQWIFFPFLVLPGILRDLKRTFLGLVLFLSLMALPFFLPFFATMLTLGAGFLKKPSRSKIARFILSLLLGIYFLMGWILFFTSPSRFFSFPPYVHLQEKLTEYRTIFPLLNSPGVILLTERDYFLASSWPEKLAIITPEDPRFRATLAGLTCHFIISTKERAENFPGFREVFRGETIVLHQRELPASP